MKMITKYEQFNILSDGDKWSEYMALASRLGGENSNIRKILQNNDVDYDDNTYRMVKNLVLKYKLLDAKIKVLEYEKQISEERNKSSV